MSNRYVELKLHVEKERDDRFVCELSVKSDNLNQQQVFAANSHERVWALVMSVYDRALRAAHTHAGEL